MEPRARGRAEVANGKLSVQAKRTAAKAAKLIAALLANRRCADRPRDDLQLLGVAMTRLTARAHLQLLPSSEGGRSTPMQSGYRSLIRFERGEVDFGFELMLDSHELAPGAAGTGTLALWAKDALPELTPGLRFEVREGTRIVGHGTLLD